MVTKIGVMGITGRMGRLIATEIITSNTSCVIAGGHAQIGQRAVGQDIGTFLGLSKQGIPITDHLAFLYSISDVIIDFTNHAVTLHHLQFAEKTHTPMVIGTTGLSDMEFSEIDRLSQKIPLVYSANMTLGIALLEALTRKATKILGDEFDAEILEMHHRYKRDAPSGTALALGEAVAQARGASFSDVAHFDRTTRPLPRQKNEIGFAVMRGGNVFGDHSVVFASDHEVVTLSHRILDKGVFAKGAVQAAIWLHDKPAGLYDMHDVLGL